MSLEAQGSHRLESRTRCAVSQKIGCVVVASPIDNLGCQPGEECLRAFRTVQQMELSLCLCADNALTQVVVMLEKPITESGIKS